MVGTEGSWRWVGAGGQGQDQGLQQEPYSIWELMRVIAEEPGPVIANFQTKRQISSLGRYL